MYTLESHINFLMTVRDVSSVEKRIVRVGTKTFEITGTYNTLKLTKRCSKRIKQLL